MTTRKPLFDRFADSVMNLDSPSYGDERERAVFMEASAFAITVSMMITLGIGLVAATLGLLLLPATMLAITFAPSLALSVYAKRKGVDITELASQASKRQQITVSVLIFTAFALTMLAMLWTMYFGTGLIDVTFPDVAGDGSPGLSGSVAIGALVGGALGGLGQFVAMRVKRRRA